MPRRHDSRSENLRRALAQEAARIMAEQGIHDFLTAKRKAGERLGVSDESVMPRNTEVEAALIEYQRLFRADSHQETLLAQRQAALRAMQYLAAFDPRLVGPVLSGTATAYADVQLHLFAERAESVALKLLDRGIAHEVTERRSSRIRKPVPHLALLQLVAAEDNKPPWGKLPHQDLCEFVSEGTRASRNQDRSIAPIHAILRIFSSPATLAVSPSGWCQE